MMRERRRRKEKNERRRRKTQRKKGDRIVTVKARRGDILRQSVTQGREVERGCKLV